jgi:hypothetical protein
LHSYCKSINYLTYLNYPTNAFCAGEPLEPIDDYRQVGDAWELHADPRNAGAVFQASSTPRPHSSFSLYMILRCFTLNSHSYNAHQQPSGVLSPACFAAVAGMLRCCCRHASLLAHTLTLPASPVRHVSILAHTRTLPANPVPCFCRHASLLVNTRTTPSHVLGVFHIYCNYYGSAVFQATFTSIPHTLRLVRLPGVFYS